MYLGHSKKDGQLVQVVNCRSGSILGSRVTLAVGVRSRLQGLLGRSDLAPDEGLWLEPCASIHMFFMRFAIDVVFVDRLGTVVKPCEHVGPWRLASGGRCARAALELPVGTIDRSDTRAGDRLELRSV
jgi:uncharacterized membrane protein (UPF0127 family)